MTLHLNEDEHRWVIVDGGHQSAMYCSGCDRMRYPNPWDACLDVDPFTGQPDHPCGDSCEGGCE